jgi:Domain of unknown function (DUF4105)
MISSRDIRALLLIVTVGVLSTASGCGFFFGSRTDKLSEAVSPEHANQGRIAKSVNAVWASTRIKSSSKPSHDHVWKANLSVLPHAKIDSDRVRLYNIRDTYYRSEDNYDVRHFDRVVMLNEVQSIDFIVVPFKNTPSLAHTMISFGLANGDHIAFSVEARLEQGESYSPLNGSMKSYELMWVAGTERDLIGLRTTIRMDDVYLYRTTVQPEQAKQVFLAAVARVNEIARTPEFYDTLTNNCTTNIVDMVNKLRPGTFQEDIRLVLPGHSDKMLYDHGMIRATGTFEQVRQASRINLAANLNFGSPNFSQLIRGNVSE